MDDLIPRAVALKRLAHELMYLGTDGSPVYSDTFCRLNKEVLSASDSLYALGASDVPEEESRLCLALLMGYAATIYDHGDKSLRKERILERIRQVLPQLPGSTLKAQLLAYSYAECYDEELGRQAHDIADSWPVEGLDEKQKEVVELLKAVDSSYE